MIDQLYSKLTECQMNRLNYSFDEGNQDYVVIDNMFIGVHVGSLPNLTIEEQKGKWSAGYVNSSRTSE